MFGWLEWALSALTQEETTEVQDKKHVNQSQSTMYRERGSLLNGQTPIERAGNIHLKQGTRAAGLGLKSASRLYEIISACGYT